MAATLALSLSMVAPAFADGQATITSPSQGDIILADTLHLAATYDGDSETLNWAVRAGSDCGPGANLAGDGPNVTIDEPTPYTYDGTDFTATVDVPSWEDGTYCFVFNPGATTDADRDVVSFELTKSARTKDACKDGGWQTFGDYRNQGECVRVRPQQVTTTRCPCQGRGSPRRP